MRNLCEVIAQRNYPGRGIAVGRNAQGRLRFAYCIMGRSINSRNRRFEETGRGIRTAALDESRMTDPSLIIYEPVIFMKDKVIITNGDQTQTIYDALTQGEDYVHALRRCTYEPDAPHFTSRISALISETESPVFSLSILRRGDEGHAQRFFYELEDLPAGACAMINTYVADGNPLPAWQGEPHLCEMTDDLEKFTENVYDALNHDNRVALCCGEQDENGEWKMKIINRWDREFFPSNG